VRELGEHGATSLTECRPQSPCLWLEDWEVEPFCSRRVPFSFLSAGCALALGAPAAAGSGIGRACSQIAARAAASIWGTRGEEHREGKTAPVPWVSSAVFLSQEMRKRSVSAVVLGRIRSA